MTPLQQADHLVRNHPANKELMELGFGCEVTWHLLYSLKIISKTTNTHTYLCIEEGRMTPVRLRIHDNDAVEILGKPPHLEHYLRVLSAKSNVTEYFVEVGGALIERRTNRIMLDFNLTTGAPATGKDAEAFIKLVS